MFIFSPIFLIFFLIVLLACVALGYRLGKNKSKKRGLDLAEGAIFTLMALVLTFTFSSANQRYDQRLLSIVQEVNAMETAYRRLDILPAMERARLQKELYDYIISRINVYRAVPDFKKIDQAIQTSKHIQQQLWQDAIQASKNSSMLATPMLILPAIETMFDVAQIRFSYTYLHPHVVVFILLFIAVLLSALLTGYGITDKKQRFSIHIIAFTLMTAFTVYVIINLEYPRLGLIRENQQFDFMIVKLSDEIGKELNIKPMKTSPGP